MKYFHCLALLGIMAAKALSENCQNSENEKSSLLHLCCETWQFYSRDSKECEQLPEHANISWQKKVKSCVHGDYRLVDILKEFKHDVIRPCHKPLRFEGFSDVLDLHHFGRNYCVTQYYSIEYKRNILLPLYRVCGENEDDTNSKSVHLNWAFIIRNASGAYCTIILLLILLPTIFIYTTIKELKDNIRLQLFMFYLTNMFANKVMGLVVFYNLYSRFYKKHQIDILANLFGVSIILWLNVIAYEIWHTTFKTSNTEQNVKKDRNRFIRYVIYVNSMAVLVINLQILAIDTTWSEMATNGVTFLFLFFNLLTFLTLSVHICRTRGSVAQLTDDTDYIFTVFKIILRLFAMMGISRIIIFTVIQVWHLALGEVVMQLVEILEAILIFLLFVMKENVRNLVKSRFGCLGATSDIAEIG